MCTRGDSGSLEAPTSGEQLTQCSQSFPKKARCAWKRLAVERKIADSQAGKAFLLDSVWWRRPGHKRAVCAMSLGSSYSVDEGRLQ